MLRQWANNAVRPVKRITAFDTIAIRVEGKHTIRDVRSLERAVSHCRQGKKDSIRVVQQVNDAIVNSLVGVGSHLDKESGHLTKTVHAICPVLERNALQLSSIRRKLRWDNKRTRRLNLPKALKLVERPKLHDPLLRGKLVPEHLPSGWIG